MAPRWTIRRIMTLAGLGVLGMATPTLGQVEIGGMRLDGDVEVGTRFFIDRPSKSEEAKFLEYRDINEGLYLHDLRLRLFDPDERYSTELAGRQWGLEDQQYSLRTGRLGTWEAGFDWDQMRHILSTNARMLATEVDRGVFRLPTPRPDLTAYNSARELDEISVRWDTAHLFLKLTPTPDIELIAEYSRIRKDGDRPFGMAFGSPGNNFLEALQPIEQTIHDFRLRGTVARELWQAQFGYTLSVFQNDERRVIIDNPCFANLASCGPGDGGAAAPASGQASLPPDNMAHTLSLQGGVTLPARTRVTGNFTYSLRLQNDAFLPHTINPALAGNVDLVLPQKSLNGNQQVFLVNVGVTSRPLPVPVTFSGRYRLYDLLDLSDQIVFPGLVQNDRSVISARRAGRFDYMRQNADLDARWQITRPLALTTGVGWERWDRNKHREVPVSDEFFAKAAIDFLPVDWIQARATYQPSFRRINRYNTRAHIEHSVLEDPGAATQGQSLLLRKFDESDRDRQRADVLVHFMPIDTLTFSPTVGYRYDDYVGSTLGLQQATTWTAGADLSWAPTPRLSFSGGYTHESIFEKQRSRSRPVIGGVAADFADYDWISNNTDTIDTFYTALKVAVLPGRLDWTTDASFSTATGRVETRNPVAPASSTPANDATATAKRFPAFEDTLWRLETALRYRFWKSWTASVSYAFESFEKHDWRTDTLQPFIGISSIYLGNDLKDYTAHIVGFRLGYRFK